MKSNIPNKLLPEIEIIDDRNNVADHTRRKVSEERRQQIREYLENVRRWGESQDRPRTDLPEIGDGQDSN